MGVEPGCVVGWLPGLLPLFGSLPPLPPLLPLFGSLPPLLGSLPPLPPLLPLFGSFGSSPRFFLSAFCFFFWTRLLFSSAWLVWPPWPWLPD